VQIQLSTVLNSVEVTLNFLQLCDLIGQIVTDFQGHSWQWEAEIGKALPVLLWWMWDV